MGRLDGAKRKSNNMMSMIFLALFTAFITVGIISALQINPQTNFALYYVMVFGALMVGLVLVNMFKWSSKAGDKHD